MTQSDREWRLDAVELRLWLDLVLAVRPCFDSLLFIASISLIRISSFPVTLHSSFTAPMFSKNIRSCIQTVLTTHN